MRKLNCERWNQAIDWLLLLLSVCFYNKSIALLFVQIYDGKDNTAQVLGAFTGSSMLGLTLISTSNHLWLEFYSDGEDTGEGFKLVYSSKFWIGAIYDINAYLGIPVWCPANVFYLFIYTFDVFFRFCLFTSAVLNAFLAFYMTKKTQNTV